MKTKFKSILIGIAFLLSAFVFAEQTTKKVYVVPIQDVIDLGIPGLVSRAVDLAETNNASLIIFDIDTFGGRFDAATQIKDSISSTEIETVAFINRRAISAGSLISLSCDQIYMTGGATIGATSVVDMSGSKQSENSQSKMREELADLQAELQKTIVFITHDLDEAVTIGDRIAIMRDGRITQLGTPEDIITNPIDDFVKEFTRDISQTRVLSVQSIASDLEQVFENNTGVSEIIQAMEDTGKEFAFIVDDDSKLLGFIDKEAIEGAADDVSLKDMDLSVIEPIHESTVIEDVVQLTLDNPYPIPIVDDENILTGLATHDAILQAFAENALQQQTN